MPAPALLLQQLLDSAVLRRADWDALPAWTRDRVAAATHIDRLVDHLLAQGLLTGYQGGRVRAGKTDGLILGSYRVLDRLAAGSMGVIFKAEHTQTRRPVAIKVMLPARGQDSRPLLRFYAERQAVAQLQHAHIVGALDVGEAATSDPDAPLLYYYVMEQVDGQDLEALVLGSGPRSEEQTRDLAAQIASALSEAHRHQLIHRDVKPSNILITAEGQAKLLDFGLVRQLSARVTEPGTSLGAFEYVAPEQLKDAGTVDIRADVYGLGSTLFWCLTGQPPFTRTKDLVKDLADRLTQPLPAVRSVRADVSPALEALIARMTALDRNDRFATPDAVLEAVEGLARPNPSAPTPAAEVNLDPARARVLVVTGAPERAHACRAALHEGGLECAEATAEQALEVASANSPDLVLLDADLPEGRGCELLCALRRDPPCLQLKILMLTASTAPESVSALLALGADGYLTSPPDAVELRTRVRSALDLKEAQNRAASEHTQHEQDEAAAEQQRALAAASPAPVERSWLNPLRWLVGRRHRQAAAPQA